MVICLSLSFLFLILLRYIFDIVKIDGASMEPTLEDGDYILSIKYFSFHKVKEGNIVIIKLPRKGYRSTELSYDLYIKRVAGVEGEVVKINLNGVSRYMHSQFQYQNGDHCIVPENCIFVLSDNIDLKGNDSLSWGPVPKANLYGLMVSALPMHLHYKGK